MSNRFIIPKTLDQLNNEGRLIVRTAGTFGVRQTLFNTSMPNEQGAYDISKPFHDTPPSVTTDKPKIKAKSFLGTQVFSNLYCSAQGNEVNIDTALFSISMTKNIIVTPIQGRNGTVKEYISDGDYNISIRGVISSTYKSFPDHNTMSKSTLDDLLGLCTVQAPIKCKSWFLNNLGIHNFVIQDYKIEQKEGEYSIIPFELNCLSDIPFEVNITK